MKPKWIILALVSLLFLTAATTVSYNLAWHALPGGGGHTSAGIYILDSAVAQPFAGSYTASGKTLCSGSMCGALPNVSIFVPAVKR